jgi:SAM-dependent methyltransferase
VFQVGDISDAAPILGDEKFDVITCLGNTAVHIDFSRQIRFLGQVCGSLKPGGLFILQILNYTNILEEGQGFSVLESENCRFIREYKTSGDKGRLFFHTSLEDRNSGEVFRNSVTHYPLLPEALMALLSMSAFAEWETMGGWDGSPAGSGRLPLIVAARSEK